MADHRTKSGEARLLQKHMPELDVLRGCAILAVLFYHGFYWSFGSAANPLLNALIKSTVVGWLGVNLFFVLSGFLITGILLDSKGKPSYYRKFYFRRVLRILPAYLAMIAVLLLAKWLNVRSALLSLLFLANYEGLFHHFHLGSYGPFWSLSVEEQFYLVWPTIVAKVSKRALTFVCIGLCFIEPLLRYLSASARLPLGDVHTTTYLIADNLALGALAAIFARSKYGTLANGVKLGLAICFLGTIVFVAGYPLGIMHRDNLIGETLQCVPWNLFFTGILLIFLGLRSPVFSSPFTSPLRFFGNISYGLYLLHVLIFIRYDDHVALLENLSLRHSLQQPLPRFFLCAGMAILIAWLSRTFYEERFLRMGRTPERSKLLTQAKIPSTEETPAT